MSMQLALARYEMPLLEIAGNRHTRADAVAYLKVCLDEFFLFYIQLMACHNTALSGWVFG